MTPGSAERVEFAIRLPAADGAPICSFGRVLLEDEVPLPEI